MEASIMKWKGTRIFYFAIVLFLMIGCHPSRQERNDPAIVESEQFRFLTPMDLNRELSREHIARLHEVLTSSILPILSGQDREEVVEIIDYFESVQKEPPTYFDAADNQIRLLRTLMQLHVMTARHNPDNFEFNMNVASYYMQNAFLIEGLVQSDNDRRLIERYKANGIKAANHLVEKFPDHAMSYAQLAHSLHITGGDKQKVAGLLKRCLEIDKGSEYCREFLDTLKSE